jgi:sorbitol-specific phosphotransferase system component IIC
VAWVVKIFQVGGKMLIAITLGIIGGWIVLQALTWTLVRVAGKTMPAQEQR